MPRSLKDIAGEIQQLQGKRPVTPQVPASYQFWHSPIGQGLVNTQRGLNRLNPLKSVEAATNNSTPAIKVVGNKLVQADTNQPIVLRGGVGNHFIQDIMGDRRSMTQPSRDTNVDDFISRVQTLKDSGGNFVALDISTTTLKRLPDLDKFINYANNNGIYVSLNPSGSFKENEIELLLDTVSKRYKDYSNMLYGGASPSIYRQEGQDEPTFYAQWATKQNQLASIIRSNSPSAPIVIRSGTSHKEFTDEAILSINRSDAVAKYPLAIANSLYMFPAISEEADPNLPNWREASDDPDIQNISKTNPVIYGGFTNYRGIEIEPAPGINQRRQRVATKLNEDKSNYVLNNLNKFDVPYNLGNPPPAQPNNTSIGFMNNKVTPYHQWYLDKMKSAPQVSASAPVVEPQAVAPQQEVVRLQAQKPSDIFSHFSDLGNQLSKSVKPIFKIK